MMRITTETRVFTMACDLILGESRRGVAAKFGITEKHLSRLLCTPEGREILSNLKRQLTDVILSEWTHSLLLRDVPKVSAADILRRINPQKAWKNVDKTGYNI